MKSSPSANAFRKSTSINSIFLALMLVGIWAFLAPLSTVSAQDDPARIEDHRGGKGLSSQILLTAQEQAWLDRRHTVRVRVADSPPYQMATPEPQGISIDYLKLIGKRFDIDFVFVNNTAINWNEALVDLTGKHRWFDLVVAIKRTPEREKEIAFTDDYLSSPWIIVNRTDSEFISQIQDLNGKKVAVENGFVVKDMIEREYPQIKVVACTTSLEALNSVASGGSDAYIANLAIASYLMRDKGLTNLKIAAPTPFGSHEQAMGVRKDWPELARIISKAFMAMSDAEESEIRNRWLSIRYEHDVNMSKVWGWIAGLTTAFLLILAITVMGNRRLKQEIDLRIKLNELFRLFMKYSPIYTFIKEIDGNESRVLQVSDNFIELVGIPASEMVGKKMHELFPAEFADRITADDLRVVKTEEMIKIEEHMQEKNFVTYKFPIQQADGTRLLAGYTIDISDLKQSEESLRSTSEYLEKLISYANAPIIVWDMDQKITRFNHAFENLTGYLKDEVTGQQLDMLFPPESRQQYQNEIARTVSGNMMEHVEIPIRCKDGSDRLVLWNSANIYDTDATTLVSTIAQGIDITERRRAEESLREIQSTLLQSDKLATIGQLAAGVAHEINNPMGFVSSNMMTLEKYIEKYNNYITQLEQELSSTGTSDGKLPLRIQELRRSLKLDYVMRDIGVLVEESNEGIERVKRIVQDLRTFSRADSSAFGSADLNKCMDSTINIVINEIKYAAELRREYGELPKVYCNVQQINQVFMNLLINAAHAIQTKGDEVGEIAIRSWCNVDNAFVSVTDNGCGIRPEIADKIFDAFYTTKEVGKGTGLGLSISAEIMRKHGGEIRVASEVGIGTTFTIRIPLEPLESTREVS